MTVTLVGTNRYAMRQRLNELVSKFEAKYGPLAVERLEAEESNLDALMAAVQSLPFLAERKLLVVKDLSFNKPAAENIEQIISSIAEEVDVVFYEPEIDRRSTIFKVLKQKTQLEEYKHLGAVELANWLTSEAKKQTASLSFSDAKYLVDRVGEDQALAMNELDKLITYDPNISRGNIDLLTTKNPQTKVFDLLDAAFAGHKHKALSLYEEQRAQKVEPQIIISMIVWQLQLLALVMSTTKNDGAIADEAGVAAYPIQKSRQLVAKIDAAKLQRMVDRLKRIDLLSKTKPLDVDEALRTYIATL